MSGRCSVGVVPHVDVFLMYLWEEGDLHILLLCHLESLSAINILKCFFLYFNACLLIKKSEFMATLHSSETDHLPY